MRTQVQNYPCTHKMVSLCALHNSYNATCQFNKIELYCECGTANAVVHGGHDTCTGDGVLAHSIPAALCYLGAFILTQSAIVCNRWDSRLLSHCFFLFPYVPKIGNYIFILSRALRIYLFYIHTRFLGRVTSFSFVCYDLLCPMIVSGFELYE